MCSPPTPGVVRPDATGTAPPTLPSDPEVAITVTLLQPQIPGGRRVVPLVPDETVIGHLRQLLDQDEVWVRRGRWVRWLRHGDPADAVPIASMLSDERVAARAWLDQQRHVLHRTIVGEGERAPDGWLDEWPLHRALNR